MGAESGHRRLRGGGTSARGVQAVQQPRLSPHSAAGSAARRRAMGEAATATPQRVAPSTDAASDSAPASASSSAAAAAAAARAALRSQRAPRRATGFLWTLRSQRGRAAPRRRAAGVAAAAAPAHASPSCSAGASQPAEAEALCGVMATASAGCSVSCSAAGGLSRSVHAQKPKTRASRSGGSSCARERRAGASALAQGVSQSHTQSATCPASPERATFSSAPSCRAAFARHARAAAARMAELPRGASGGADARARGAGRAPQRSCELVAASDSAPPRARRRTLIRLSAPSRLCVPMSSARRSFACRMRSACAAAGGGAARG